MIGIETSLLSSEVGRVLDLRRNCVLLIVVGGAYPAFFALIAQAERSERSPGKLTIRERCASAVCAGRCVKSES